MARKTRPKFSVGTYVYNLTTGATGTIKGLIESDYVDGRFYEWRYEVYMDGWLSSVPERCLTSSKRRYLEHAATKRSSSSKSS